MAPLRRFRPECDAGRPPNRRSRRSSRATGRLDAGQGPRRRAAEMTRCLPLMLPPKSPVTMIQSPALAPLRRTGPLPVGCPRSVTLSTSGPFHEFVSPPAMATLNSPASNSIPACNAFGQLASSRLWQSDADKRGQRPARHRGNVAQTDGQRLAADHLRDRRPEDGSRRLPSACRPSPGTRPAELSLSQAASSPIPSGTAGCDAVRARIQSMKANSECSSVTNDVGSQIKKATGHGVASF